jgi:hypothetical protein
VCGCVHAAMPANPHVDDHAMPVSVCMGCCSTKLLSQKYAKLFLQIYFCIMEHDVIVVKRGECDQAIDLCMLLLPI